MQSDDLALLNKSLKDCIIKQIFSYPHYLVVALHGREGNFYLYIARGKVSPTLLFDSKKIEKIPRVDDKYVHITRSFLKGQYVSEVSLDLTQGMLVLRGSKGRSSCALCMFYKKDGVYFSLSLRAEGFSKYFASWDGRIQEFPSSTGIEKLLASAPSGNGLKLSLQLTNASYLEMWDRLQRQYESKSEKRTNLKKNKIEGDLANLKTSIAQIEKDLNENFEFQDNYEYAGHKIKFLRQSTLWKKREVIFNKLKALKKGLAIQEQRLAGLSSREKENLKVTLIRPLNPIWRSGPSALKSSTSIAEGLNDVMELKTDKNALVKIGTNETGNDFLLTSWSKASDLWVHLHEYPSAHAVIRFGDAKRDQLFELLDEIAIVLKKLSGLTDENVSLIYTERRWVKPMKGSKGKVKLSKFHLYLPRR